MPLLAFFGGCGLDGGTPVRAAIEFPQFIGAIARHACNEAGD